MPNISIPRHAALIRAERELEAQRNRAAAQPFADAFCHNIGVCLALTPKADWHGAGDRIIKAAFDATRRQIPTGAEIYLSLLPQPEPRFTPEEVQQDRIDARREAEARHERFGDPA